MPPLALPNPMLEALPKDAHATIEPLINPKLMRTSGPSFAGLMLPSMPGLPVIPSTPNAAKQCPP